MRDTFRITILAALFLAGCSTYDRELLGDPEPAEPAQPVYTEEADPAAEDSMGVGMFNELRYYGQWHRLDPYGWVWRPSVAAEWRPFGNGHWIWSQYGWMWVDYDPWGWATSHYGYWAVDYAMGWVWIPDYTWSPVQCDWLVYEDYVCWSPVPPPGVKYKEPWEAGDAWVTVPMRRFKERNVANYHEAPKFKDAAHQTMYRAAPDVRDVERHGPKFSTVDVQLDRRVVGEREFAKVKFPPDQQQIIEGQRSGVKSSGTSSSYTPVSTVPPPTAGTSNNGGSNVGPTKPAKSGEPAKKESKFKDRKGGDKKDESKSKPKDPPKEEPKSGDNKEKGKE